MEEEIYCLSQKKLASVNVSSVIPAGTIRSNTHWTFKIQEIIHMLKNREMLYELLP